MKLAVIGTFYKKPEESQRAFKAVLASTRKPDEFWALCEREEDLLNLLKCFPDGVDIPEWVHLLVVPTPNRLTGAYAVTPYSFKINLALDLSEADAFVYLDNGSVPHPLKYEMMLAVLEAMPEMHTVYCSQERTGYAPTVFRADRIVLQPFCTLNFTQVMHRRTHHRWSLDLNLAVPTDLVDAYFWEALKTSYGPFYPVPSDEILDWHHIPSPAANGMGGTLLT